MGAGGASGAAWPPDFGAAVREAEQELVGALGLEPLALPAGLAHAEGTWQGEPVRAMTRGYRSDRAVYARFTVVEGAGLSIGNVVCLPADDSALPILGADLVWIGTRPDVAMIAADLSPSLLAGRRRERQLERVRAELSEAQKRTKALTRGGPLPAWCESLFSPHALYVRMGSNEIERGIEGFGMYVSALSRLASIGADAESTVATEDVRAGRARYCEGHRVDDKGLMLLARLFGHDWAREFVHEVLFPDFE